MIINKIVKILKTRIVMALLSSIIFYVSCWYPAFEVIMYNSSQNQIVDGGYCFVGGCLGLFYCFFCPWNIIWLANPIYILSMLLFVLLDGKRGKDIALALCLCSIVMGLSFLFCTSLCTSESGSPSDIGTLYIGYYYWILSFIILLIGMTLHRKANQL